MCYRHPSFLYILDTGECIVDAVGYAVLLGVSCGCASTGNFAIIGAVECVPDSMFTIAKEPIK